MVLGCLLFGVDWLREKRRIRFGKWVLKAVVSYAVFISIGLLLSLVPASGIGLSEEMFFNLRIFFMLFGPIYLTLIVKILLAFLTVIKGKGFLNVFLPVAFSLLILEILTLFVCIVTFAPLPRAASNAFICAIALTALLLLMVPLVLSLVSGYQGDKAGYAKKRAGEKQKAVRWDVMVLESDPVRRKRYLRLPKILALLVCPGVCLISGFVLALTKNSQELLPIQLLRESFLALMAVAAFSFIPLLMYWGNCSGTSLVQRVYLAKDQLYYAGYSGSMEERVEFLFTLIHLEGYRVGKRAIHIRGQFTKKTKDFYGSGKKGPFTKTLWLPRTFPVEQEQALLQFLRDKAAQISSL